MTDGLSISRTFAVSRELVFDAWTRPEYFSVWFGTAAVEVPLKTLTMDVRPGGAWSAVMHLPDGSTIDWVGEYEAVDPPARLAFTMTDNPADPARGLVTVLLSEVDAGTEMIMTQAGLDFTDEQITQTVAGYNGFFDTMEQVLAQRA